MYSPLSSMGGGPIGYSTTRTGSSVTMSMPLSRSSRYESTMFCIRKSHQSIVHACRKINRKPTHPVNVIGIVNETPQVIRTSEVGCCRLWSPNIREIEISHGRQQPLVLKRQRLALLAEKLGQDGRDPGRKSCCCCCCCCRGGRDGGHIVVINPRHLAVYLVPLLLLLLLLLFLAGGPALFRQYRRGRMCFFSLSFGRSSGSSLGHLPEHGSEDLPCVCGVSECGCSAGPVAVCHSER
jgi:hypothetical protein